MDLHLTAHALDQMSYRNVTLEEVQQVLSAPQWSPATTRSTRYDAIVDGQRLAIVVDEVRQPGVITVVTAFWPDLPGGRRTDR